MHWGCLHWPIGHSLASQHGSMVNDADVKCERETTSHPRERERRLAGGRRSVRRRSVGRRVGKVRVAAGEAEAVDLRAASTHGEPVDVTALTRVSVGQGRALPLVATPAGVVESPWR